MAKTIVDKVGAFLEELEKRGIQISGETAFICNDGAVLFRLNERDAIDIILVRNPVPIDYTLGITDEEVQAWRDTEDLVEALGGAENGGD